MVGKARESAGVGCEVEDRAFDWVGTAELGNLPVCEGGLTVGGDQN